MNDLLFRQDAEHKERAYQGLARHYLSSGESWLALHAQLIADLAAANAVSGYNVSQNRTPDGANTLATLLGSASTTSLGESVNPKNAVDRARKEIEKVVDTRVLRAWENRLSDPSAYEFASDATPTAARVLRETRLGGQSPEEFVTSRRTAAEANYQYAVQCYDAGDEWGAIEAIYGADLFNFEAWLVQRSINAGDDLLVQVELKWTLAMKAIDQMGAMPTVLNDAVRLVRSRLAWALGPVDAALFANQLPALV